MYRANAVDYRKMCNSMFYGKALTDEYLTVCTNQIIEFLRPCKNARAAMGQLGIGIKEFEKGGAVYRVRLVFASGKNAGRELSVSELEGIAHFLYGGILGPVIVEG